MDEGLRSLFLRMRMENTRLLVKGVERLHRGYQRELLGKPEGSALDEKAAWRLDSLQKFINNAYDSCIVDGNQFLAQNPYTELFRFRQTAQLSNRDMARLSGMVLLYHQMRLLENPVSDYLAEDYEILCNSMRSIQNADMCYLVFRQLNDTHILCASSVKREDLDSQLGSQEAGELLDQLQIRESFHEISENVFVKSQGEKPIEKSVKGTEETKRVGTMILPVMLYDQQSIPQEQQVFLICQRRGTSNWDEDIEDTLLQVRDTFFLRGQMVRVLMRDLNSLLAVGKEYRNMSRKSADGGPLRILHISDLHVTEKNCEQLRTYIGNLKLKQKPFDFLVITGDVVQGRYAAGDLEQHYRCAAQVIRALAFRMWSEEEDGISVLRQDWKRRTIVIPGNHDYASMNELETQHGENHRASEGGRPAIQEGSAMVKFTYYINFVRKLLDVDIGELIDNELNELRCYDKMGINFICFNTCIMANPARNNKVHLDRSFAQRTIRQLSLKAEKKPTIFLGHHGPDYKIDYISDEYLEPYICHELTDAFIDAVQLKNDKSKKRDLAALVQRMDTLKGKDGQDIVDNPFVQTWLLQNSMQELPRDVVSKVMSCWKKTHFYHDLTFLLAQLEKDEKERRINERYQKIFAELKRTVLLSRNDQAAYAAVFKMVQELGLTACLSGHTHTWNHGSDQHFVAMRFFWEEMIRDPTDKNSLIRIASLHYGVCEIPQGKANPTIAYLQVDEKVWPYTSEESNERNRQT